MSIIISLLMRMFRVETHSDYHGSPEGKLDAPVQTRGTRSLDTSPLGYQSKSRKVEVKFYNTVAYLSI